MNRVPGQGQKPTDPLTAQAKKIFSQRKARLQLIDRDLLGEPGWDILLCIFIAGREGYPCPLEHLMREVELSADEARRWTALLASRDMLSTDGRGIHLTAKAEDKLKVLFRGLLNELRFELMQLGVPLARQGLQ